MHSSSIFKGIGIFAWRALIILSLLTPNFKISASNSAIAASESELQAEGFSVAAIDTSPARREIIRQAPRMGMRPEVVGPENHSAQKPSAGQPVQFVENVGQFDPRVRFVVYVGNSFVQVREDSLWFSVLEPVAGDMNGKLRHTENENTLPKRKGVHLKVSFNGSKQHPILEPITPLDTRISYLTGKDSEGWYTSVPVWGGVRYIDLYPGIDLELTSQEGQFIWQWNVKEGASITEIRPQIDGADGITVQNGKIQLSTGIGNFSLPQFRLAREMGARQPGSTELTSQELSPLISLSEDIQLVESIQSMSPGGAQDLVYSTYLGGLSTDYPGGIAVDAEGAAYITGTTYSVDFPTTPGAYDPDGPPEQTFKLDTFVTKLNKEGTGIVYSTFLGGIWDDYGEGIDVDPITGEAFVIGSTVSPYFLGNPECNPLDEDYDVFVVKLNALGSGLGYVRCMGDTYQNEYGYGIAVDAQGAAYVLYHSEEITYNDMILPGVWVKKLSPGGSSFVYSNNFGGTGRDFPYGIDVDDQGKAYIAGGTTSSDFPTTDGSSYHADYDAFAVRLSGVGSLEYATLLGGAGGDRGYDIAASDEGLIYIGGVSSSEGFFTIIAADGTHLSDTYLGGSGVDVVWSLSVDEYGRGYLAGQTSSPDFPITTDAFQPSCNGCSNPASTIPSDGFISIFEVNGALVYSTYIGGSSSIYEFEAIYGLAVKASGEVYITGQTDAPDFPTTPGAYDPSYNGGRDTFISKFDFRPAIPEESIWNDCDLDGCLASYGGAMEYEGEPINTFTGAYEYSVADISLPVQASLLAFKRTFSAMATGVYSSNLGAGWTHSLDTRLVLPGSPGGEPGRVFFKAHSANQYEFIDNEDGSYSPYPGVMASLTRQDLPVVTYTLTISNQETYQFDSQGRLARYEDAQGHRLDYSYEETSGRLLQVSDESGARYLHLNYNPEGRIDSVVDHTNRQVSYGYLNDNLVSAVDIMGQTWTYRYDDVRFPHYLTEVIDPGGNTVERTEYDAEGRAFRQYDGLDNLILELGFNPDSTTTITQTVDGTVYTNTHTYDSRRTLRSEEDALGGMTTKIYDANFRPISITDPLSQTTSLGWSADGKNLSWIVDAAGQRTDLGYDGLNNLTSIIDARGFLTTNEYSGTLLVRSTDAYSNTTVYTYTTGADYPQPPNLLKALADPLGHVTSYTYDQYGQRITTTDPLGRVTGYDYDDLGRLVKVVGPSGLADWTCYDAAGRVVRSVRNATGGGGTPQSDPCDVVNYQPSQLAGYDRISSMVYDLHGNAIAAIDPNGLVTRTYYDDAKRPVTVVQNLAGQTIEAPTPPAYNPVFPDQNLRTDTVYDVSGNVIAGIDALGRITRTYYDSLGRPRYMVQNLVGQAILDPNPPAFNPAYPDQNVRSETVYDAAGNAIASIDALERVTRTYYDPANRPVTVARNLFGQTIDNPVAPVFDPNYPDRNLRSDSVYDQNGNPIAEIDALGRITRRYYDALNRVETVVQNLSGQAISVETPPLYNPDYPDQNVRSDVVYDEAGNQVAVVDPNGVVTRTYYDDGGRTYLVVRNLFGQGILEPTPPAYNPAFPDRNVRSETEYAADGKTIAAIDPNGIITRTYYDALDRPYLAVRNLFGQSIQEPTPPLYIPVYPDRNVRMETAYDADGRAIASLDNAGRISRTYFDALYRPVAAVQNLAGQSIENPTPPAFDPNFPDRNVRSETIYGPGGNVQRTIGPTGQVTFTCYDGLYRVVKSVLNPSVSDPCTSYTPSAEADRDITTLTIYDAAGSALFTIDPNEKETTYQYDAVRRLLQITDPELNTTSFSYDGAGSRITLTNALGVVTRYEYDALGRLTAVVENYRPGFAANHETNVRTEYRYDAGGNRLAIRDANAVLNSTQDVTSFTYDALGRLLTERDPLNHTTTYGYDAAGNRVSLLDANGYTTSYIYDGLQRLKTIDYPAPDADVTFTYTAAGGRESMVDGIGTTSWDYDSLGRVLSATDPFTGTVQYGYDASGMRTSLVYPDSKTVANGYDDAGRLQTVTGWDALDTLYTYTRAGQALTAALPNGVTSSYAYDDAGRLLSLTHSAAQETLASFQYALDGLGNRTTLTETLTIPSSYSGQGAFGELAESSAKKPAAVDFSRLPLSFIPNAGQTDAAVRFVVQHLGGTLFFTPGEVVLEILNPSNASPEDDRPDEKLSYGSLAPSVVRITYQGASASPLVSSADPLPGVANYLLGSDPSKWRANLPTYGNIVYQELYPGIDLRFEGTQGQLKSLFLVSPGADPAAIRWSYSGAKSVSLDAQGNLVIALSKPRGAAAAATLREQAPVAWQERDGVRQVVAVSYEVSGDGSVGFALPEGYDPGLPLVIDPVLTYSTLLGRSETETGMGIVIGSDGSAYVTGSTTSSNFPTVNPLQGYVDGEDVYISKLSPDGSALLYSTFLGGAGHDKGRGIVLDSSGRIAVVGETESSNFPTVAAYDSSYAGGSCASGPCDDVFVAQLTPDGSALRYSSYLGGAWDEEGEEIAVDANGVLYLTGWTTSSGFPVLNGFDASHGGGTCGGEPCPDGFLASIDPSLSGASSLRYSTFVGGSNADKALDLALDGSGNAYLTGYTRSSNFPVLTPFQPSRTGDRDAFLTQIDPSLSGGASLRYSTFLGGDEEERGTGVALDGEGRVYLTGFTRSDDFPLANPLQAARGGTTCGSEFCSDVFASKLDLVSNTLLYSTYLGGTGDDEAQALAVDESNQAFVAGFTYSADFPLAEPFQAQKGSEGCSAPPCTDAFVLALNPSGGALLYSSYLGGSKDDYAYDLALDGQGDAYLTGETYSTDFPTTPGAYDVTLEGTKRDAFVVKVSQPSTAQQETQVIHYTYDPLGRLTAADYDDGTYFHYTYDSVGNRLSETTPLGTTSYDYDIANRLTAVNAVTYTWDDNGNLVNDGTNTYSYDHANRLVGVSGPSSAVYSYNGLGDRLQQTVNSATTNYTLDLASGLTQVLTDGANTYLYGRGRIGEQQSGGFVVHLGDALGSVRQLVDSDGSVSLISSYEPFGEVLNASGFGETDYGFTGEWTDNYIKLIYLRARYYAPADGRFISRDSWPGDYSRPLSLNRWLYVYSNPINYLDPSGLQGTDPRCTGWSSSWFVPDNLKNEKCVELWSAHDAGDTATIYNWYSWLWSTYSFGPFEYASDLGMHFLGNTGEDYQMPEGFGKAIRGLKIVKESIKDHKNWYMVNYVKPIVDRQTSVGSYIFGRDDFANGIAVTGVDPYRNVKIYLAWNAFFIDVHYQGTVEKNSTILGYTYTIKISMSYRAHDTYDWHPGLTIPNPFGGQIPDAWAYLLDEECLAESFDSFYEWSNQEKHTIIFNNWPKYKTNWAFTNVYQ